MNEETPKIDQWNEPQMEQERLRKMKREKNKKNQEIDEWGETQEWSMDWTTNDKQD